MKKLIFDIEITGHHAEYISHLIDHIYNNKDTNEYFFIVNSNFTSKFPIISGKVKSIKNINFIEIELEELRSLQQLGVFKKSFVEFRLMNYYALKFNVNHVCLLYFNTFQLACFFFRTQYTISGILFFQFYRMNKNTFNDKLKYYRKYLTTKMYSMNPKIQKIHILNDQNSVDFFNKEFKNGLFEMLPDPIPNLKPLDGFDIYSHYNIDKKRKIFLHIGSLGERKGTFEVIESALNIPLKNQREVTILLVGCVLNKEDEEIVLNKIEESNIKSNVTIIWDNQFVSNSMMKSLFDQCFSVLMPYKNTEGSSGILGHAISAQKQVIATGKGLLKELIEENNLGLLIAEVTPVLISEKILLMLTRQLKVNGKSSELLSSHSASIFSKKILLN